MAGITFTGLLHKERIEQSCSLLKHTGKTAAEIAQLVGMPDRKHFHRVFKRLTGMTSIAYRKEADLPEPDVAPREAPAGTPYSS
ncbi:helix-turn-helix transcriptional regulator [Paenibacillus arenilitoris]|uniref:Helix-turn-helix transcriptional regulator n=1 Tax=Paenibacillus arenilitoris TaxID=2772299 RepID=A0A927H5Q2_9BACL|nr:helix-turn-helix transcriptional regulator [Paenibacillus arenilitoris]MBD2869180.1 helix-turn-helix transcriptional regulator [Paenibacillus arenilitoris]